MSACELSAYERWMVSSNMARIAAGGMSAATTLATLRANGYPEIATAVEEALAALAPPTMLIDMCRGWLRDAREEGAVERSLPDAVIDREASKLETRIFQLLSSFVDNEFDERYEPEPDPHSPVELPPADVVACGADPDVPLCAACIDAYRNGIEPGETACEARAKQ